MPRIRMSLGIGLVGRREDFYDYPDDEWAALTDEQKEQELDAIAIEFASSYVDSSAWVEE